MTELLEFTDEETLVIRTPENARENLVLNNKVRSIELSPGVENHVGVFSDVMGEEKMGVLTNSVKGISTILDPGQKCMSAEECVFDDYALKQEAAADIERTEYTQRHAKWLGCTSRQETE